MDKKIKILIVDDEAVIRDGCQKILNKNGYEVECAEDVSSGLKKVSMDIFDIVLLDLKMPGVSGLEFLKNVRQTNPDIVNVIITGYASIESAVDAMKLGAYDYIPKPFSPDQLRQVVTRAIEKRRLVEEAKKLKRQQEQFALMVYHEFKLPLSIVKGYLSNLMKEKNISESEQYNNMITRSLMRIDSLLQLSEDMLNISLLREEKIKQKIESVSIIDILNDSIESVSMEANKRGIVIELKVLDEIPFIMIDRDDIKKIFINLLTNAIKYNRDKGSIFVSIGKKGQFINIQIKDTGIGIMKEYIDKIFDEFYRVKDENTRMITGTGLGLSIVKNIVDSYKGYIEVESEPDKGSTFTICLPLHLN
ncbi:MAG: response regulator [bacterium]